MLLPHLAHIIGERAVKQTDFISLAMQLRPPQWRHASLLAHLFKLLPLLFGHFRHSPVPLVDDYSDSGVSVHGANDLRHPTVDVPFRRPSTIVSGIVTNASPLTIDQNFQSPTLVAQTLSVDQTNAREICVLWREEG